MLILRGLPDPSLPLELFLEPSVAGQIARAEFFGWPPAELTGAGVIDLDGQAEVRAPATGTASGSLDLDGQAAAKAPVQGSGAGSLDLDGQAEAKAPAKGQASGSLDLDGQAVGRAPARAEAAGDLTLGGQGVLVIGATVDLTTGRLAFAEPFGRRGTLLTDRQGTKLLNTARRGQIMEIA